MTYLIPNILQKRIFFYPSQNLEKRPYSAVYVDLQPAFILNQTITQPLFRSKEVSFSLPIRYFLVAAFVAVYMTIGFIVRPNPSAYVLIGIPLTVLFQLFIARQPIHKLWMRDEEKFSLNTSGWIITIALLIFPVYQLIHTGASHERTLVKVCYHIATILGAFAAGFSFSKLNKQSLKQLFICLGIVLLIKGITFTILLASGKASFNYLTSVTSLLTYLPIAFIVEEVVFRGLLDTFLDQKKGSMWSVLFISALWALWHLPLSTSNESILFKCFSAFLVTGIWGIPLSISWRRSGNLAVPVFSHAFIDAIRDALTR